MPSYTVTVATGSQWFAGTDDYVYLSLEGTAGCSERHLLDKPFYNDFERGAVSACTAPAQPAVPVPLLPGWGWASGQASRGSELSIATLNGSCKTAPGTGLGWRWAVRGAARAHPVACAVLCPAAISIRRPSFQYGSHLFIVRLQNNGLLIIFFFNVYFICSLLTAPTRSKEI